LIAGPLNGNNSGDQKGDKGSPGDERPETRKSRNYRSKSQETKLTLGYAQSPRKMMRSKT
jgi:hypothetical protein